MLAFDFDYYKPVSLHEAVELFYTLYRQGKQPLYFSGGTELITLGRLNLAYTEAVIDIKNILEMHVMQTENEELILGAAVPLSRIEEMTVFPLLAEVAGEIADHTAREKITLGGNIAARIFYREAALPFLLGETQAIVAGREGRLRKVLFADIFKEQLRLEKEELLVQFIIDRKLWAAPFFTVKRRQQWETGYPLITIAAVKLDGEIRVAISGLCPFPFRLENAESFLNNREFSEEEQINKALAQMPSPILDDVEGSADYRIFVLKNLLKDILVFFRGVA